MDAASSLLANSYLIVGLGNPGPRYALTPHNLGFLVIDELAKRWKLDPFQNKFHGQLGKYSHASVVVHLLKPETFMNRSGISVGEASRFYKLPASQVLIISDDIDLEIGVLRLRTGGGAGGHNGLKSVAESLGTEDYPRLRIGVGRSPVLPPDEQVLAKITSAQMPLFTKAIERAADGIELIIKYGVTKTMNTVNQKEKTP